MVINTSIGDFLVTGHAEAKMMLANISSDEVRRVIEDGNLDYTSQGDEIYRFTPGKCEIGVVISDASRIIIVFVVE